MITRRGLTALGTGVSFLQPRHPFVCSWHLWAGYYPDPGNNNNNRIKGVNPTAYNILSNNYISTVGFSFSIYIPNA
jgi:hypothetical protein